MTSTSAGSRSNAATPPQGWNSWDCFGTGVTESEVRENALFLSENLLSFGFDTVVVDIQWYEAETKSHGYMPASRPVLDGHGRQLPAPNRFPSSTGGRGFAPLAAEVHGMGLLFGVHLMRGVPRAAVALDLPIPETEYTLQDIAAPADACTWNPDNVGVDHTHPGAQAWIDAQVAQLAAWGVDFLKVDDVLWPFHEADIRAYNTAISRCGRPIVLSLSPGRALSTEHASVLRETAEMWRVSDDLWDEWNDILEQFPRAARWSQHAGDGRWIDLDMLPLGRIGIRAERGADRLSRLTEAEQRTLMSLWCIVRSPLMFGGHLPDTPASTLSLLRNREVLGMLQHARDARELFNDRGWIGWAAGAEESGAFRSYAAFFRVGDVVGEIDVLAADVGFGAEDRVIDLWTGSEVPIVDGPVGGRLIVSADAHDVVLLAAQR